MKNSIDLQGVFIIEGNLKVDIFAMRLVCVFVVHIFNIYLMRVLCTNDCIKVLVNISTLSHPPFVK